MGQEPTAIELRAGPTHSLALSNTGGSALVLAGWRLRQAVWEKRFAGSQLVDATFGGEVSIAGDRAALDDFASGIFELELLADAESTPAGKIITSKLLGTKLSDALWASASTLGREPTSANRDLDIGTELSDAGYSAVDFLLCTLPTRRGVLGAEVFFGSRWIRIYVGPRGIISVIASPPEGRWDDHLVRWPHHAIHSRATDWFTPSALKRSLDRRFTALVHDITTHESYFARSWSAELELWEQQVFRSLTGLSGDITDAELGGIERELGFLAEYLSATRIANRNLERRAEVSGLVLANPKLASHLASFAIEQHKLYEDDRQKLRSAITLLNTVAQSAQSRASEAQRKSSERIQQLITLISAVFLVPSIVLGIYGSNLRELTGGAATGSLGDLFVWVLGALGITWAALRLGQSRSIVPGRWWFTVIALLGFALVLGVCVMFSQRNPESLIVAASAYVVTGTLAIAGLYRGKRASRVQRTPRSEKEKA